MTHDGEMQWTRELNDDFKIEDISDVSGIRGEWISLYFGG